MKQNAFAIQAANCCSNAVHHAVPDIRQSYSRIVECEQSPRPVSNQKSAAGVTAFFQSARIGSFWHDKRPALPGTVKLRAF